MKVIKNFLFIKIIIASIAIVGFSSNGFAENLWQDIKSQANKQSAESNRKTAYQQARFIELNESQMRVHLSNEPSNKANNNYSKLSRPSHSDSKTTISIPLPDGNNINVSVSTEALLQGSLKNKFPDIKLFRVLPDKQVIGGRLDLTINGFHAMLQMRNGEVIFIDPVNSDAKVYASYQKSNQKQEQGKTFSCGADHLPNSTDSGLRMSRVAKPSQTQGSLITYRIAIAATGEYTAKYGGTVEGAMAAISTTLNRINQIYERDLGIHLKLVENNDLLIHTDSESDPYSGDSQVELVNQNQNYIDHIIGNEKYDVGHLFTDNGGGLAAIGSVCDTHDKGKGISGINNPQNDSFNLDFVAHELGHQLGATHTFNSTQGLCSGDSRSASTAFEPGSGSTIMSYAGYCGLDNLQSHSDAMFHIGSIKQIQTFTSNGKGSRCGVHLTTQNKAPFLDAGKNYTIPSRTPFELKGKATDFEDDELVYSWEQMDTGKSSQLQFDKGDNALFRVYMPSSNSSRIFPVKNDLLNHSHTKGETLPSTDRSLKFNLIAQDGYNETQSDEMVVHVKRTGSRFALNLPQSQYTTGVNYKLSWNVANTDQAPINCQNVDISLSTNGGDSFDQTLATEVANIGETWITIPADSPITTEGRFKISCSDNIFFAVSFRNFVITEQVNQVTYIFDDEGQPENDLLDKEVTLESAADSTPITKQQSEGGGALNLNFLSLLLLTILGRRFIKIPKKVLVNYR